MRNKEFYVNITFNLFPNFLYLLKKRIMLKMIKKHGKNIRGMRFSSIDGYETIEIGNNFFAAEGLFLSSTEGIIIKDDVTIGPYVMVIGGNHKTDTPGKKINQLHSGDKLLPIVIGNDVWIGSRAVILSGVTIGEGTIIGAGSIVTRSMPPYAVCAGNPCRPIKPRFKTLDQLEWHLKKVESEVEYKEVMAILLKYGFFNGEKNQAV